MGLNDTPKGERVHIAVFGRRNAGKSSLINRITGQNLSIVSDVLGTTTDPVYKAMELLPLGPVMMIDTPGLDDEGELGVLRIQKTKLVLNKSDIAIVVLDGEVLAPIDSALDASLRKIESVLAIEKKLIQQIQDKQIPYLVVLNKMEVCSCLDEIPTRIQKALGVQEILCASAKTKQGIQELKEKLGTMEPTDGEGQRIVGDLIKPGDFLVLVVPIDKAAPKGRLILPQQQTIRDILEADATAIVVKENELKETFVNLGKKPAMVITDSQAFSKVSADTPEDIPLTSFSILFSRYKGDLEQQILGVKAVEEIQDGDIILMAEGCTHHRQCDDIGTVKLPRWLREYTGKKIFIETASGTEFPEDLSKYKMIVHCGGCMLNRREMQFRLKQARDQEIPIVNYGILIAYLKGILERSLEPFPQILHLLGED